MSLLDFLEDFGIDYYTEGKNIGKDWVGLNCPRCSDQGHHLGMHPDTGAFKCWRCGKMGKAEAIACLVNVSWKEAHRLLKLYDRKSKRRVERKPKIKNVETTLPPESGKILESHRDYLINRNFDPDQIERDWNIYGTSYIGDYKFRIIAPIYYRNELVSFQSRDITDRSELRYKACPSDYEKIHHKYLLYGFDFSKKDVVVVEGIFDCWRLGYGAVATFGASVTNAQIKVLANYRRVFVLFDEEENQSVENGIQLANELQLLGIESECIYTGKDCDPADLSNDDANHIMKELLIK